MIIIHGMKETTLPRLAAAALRERLQVMPAVVVSGARQAGKSTLVQEQVAGRRIYATLDDLDVFDVARRDPMALVGGGARQGPRGAAVVRFVISASWREAWPGLAKLEIS
jgi:hypothetical protein